MTDSERLLDSITLPILVINRDDTVKYVNEATEALFGVSRHRISAKPLSTLLAANADICALVQRSFKQNDSLVSLEQSLHLVQLRQSRLVNVSIRPMLNGNEVEHVLLELNPVSLLQQSALEGFAKQRSKAARHLLRGLSHEIKNPLGGIRGAAQLAQRQMQQTPASQDIEESMQVIIRETDRVSNLLDRLSVADKRIDKQAQDIEPLLLHCLQLIKAEWPQLALPSSLQLDCDRSLPWIELDGEQITQALLNILKNAAAFATRETSPVIIVRTRLADNIGRAYLNGQAGMAIAIEDNGPGVDEAVKDSLFFPMIGQREGGSGLGLAISQDIARNHGGVIDFANTQQGACFTLYFPFKEQSSEQLQAIGRND